MFLLFAGDIYYPCGGWEDYRGVYGSVELARAAVQEMEVEWWHIVDAAAGRIVEEG
jgi:hypothetical protein